MKATISIIEERQSFVRELGGWRLEIAIYRLGDKFVCIVNNQDSGATICRISASSRKDALRQGLEQAAALLATTPLLDVERNLKTLKPELGFILFEEDGKRMELFVGQFLAYSLPERMRLILSGGLHFFDAYKKPIDSGTAMALLGVAAANLASCPDVVGGSERING